MPFYKIAFMGRKKRNSTEKGPRDLTSFTVSLVFLRVRSWVDAYQLVGRSSKLSCNGCLQEINYYNDYLKGFTLAVLTSTELSKVLIQNVKGVIYRSRVLVQNIKVSYCYAIETLDLKKQIFGNFHKLQLDLQFILYAPVRIDTRLFHVCTATSLSSAVGKCDAARREWMRTNHSINSVLYDPLDAILSNKADATYALNIAVTNATFDSVSSNIDVA
ncbi:hypothetical protein V1477_016257 [Vespula maculifrons]|uniref:Uncharacterized protein n=1 Tax=Vespula maculifrons TaxID=7453 RepID=A0ABD2BCI7_VESMC